MSKKAVHARSKAAVTKRATESTRTRTRATTSIPAVTAKVTGTVSKSDQILALLRRTGGASLDELMKASHWQPHSVRGFLSGAVRKRMGLTLVSAVSDQGPRRYRIAVEAGT
jgi:hypothetical protein